MIAIVSATRRSEVDFWEKSPLGISLRRLAEDRRLVPQITFENSRGLPDIYNERIDGAAESDTLVFLHDDVWLDDYFIADRVLAGLRDFDVVGVAGNRRRLPKQMAWFTIDNRFTPDDEANLSGAVGHSETPFGVVSRFGSTPAECELLDGLFFAVRCDVLRRAAVRFDSRFTFHFYDLDFCRSARQAGLRLGTWPICLTHQSGGNFGSPPWIAAYKQYLAKWRE